MSPDPQPPQGIDVTRPSPARTYDYLLGGRDNYIADRAAAGHVLAVAPEMKDVAIENRRFLIRAVRSLVGQGFDQFLDLGSGLPTQENVHEVAQAINPAARVVYVDRDPSVLAHARALLGTNNPNADYVHADIRSPEEVLTAPETVRLLSFSRPIVAIFVAVLHFVSDDDRPAELVEQYVKALPPGSRVVLASGSSDELDEDVAERIRLHFTNVPSPLHLRPKSEIAALLGDLPLEEPGLVHVTDWPTPGQSRRLPMTTFGGVARVP